MKTFATNLENNLTRLKKLLPAEDILTYAFQTQDGISCAIVYADGMVNKELLGELVARPLAYLCLQETKKDGGRVALNEIIARTTRFPEIKEAQGVDDAIKQILDGNALLLVDGVDVAFIVGAKLLPVRSIIEPPTDIAVKGPREGFIEDIKTNMALVRKRLKTPDLRFQTLRIGKRSDTAVVVCWLDGTSNPQVKDELVQRLQNIDMDIIPDSSYIAALATPERKSIFRAFGTTEKPDIFTAKIAEGRVGILVDGSPIALTAPFLLTEDLQSSEDYFISPFVATTFRFLRLVSLFVAILLPAFYISAQLFKIQLLPLGLSLTIAGSTQEIPLSPSLEMFVVLLLLEILKEASIRMPKYVGMSLSVVGALVLGETAVSAGFLSTPAIIVVAFSGICLYTVPAFVETGGILRWLFLLVSGGLGAFGIVLTFAFVLYYLLTADSFQTPLLAPFSPLIKGDLRDSIARYSFPNTSKRPQTLDSPNRTRYRRKGEKNDRK